MQAAGRQERVLDKISISKRSWQWKVPPLPFTKICLSSYHWVSHSLQTLHKSWWSYMWTHAHRAQKQRVCMVVGISIYVTTTLDVERQAHREGLKSFWVIMESSNKKCWGPWTGFTLQESWQWKIWEEGGAAGKKDRWGVGGWQGRKKQVKENQHIDQEMKNVFVREQKAIKGVAGTKH